jgi:hypothetical protein
VISESFPLLNTEKKTPVRRVGRVFELAEIIQDFIILALVRGYDFVDHFLASSGKNYPGKWKKVINFMF